MYTNVIKLFAKNENELKIPKQSVRIHKDDIGMRFKCAMLIMKSRKWQMTEGTELQNQETIRTLGENGNYKYMGMFKAEMIKQAEMN